MKNKQKNIKSFISNQNKYRKYTLNSSESGVKNEKHEPRNKKSNDFSTFNSEISIENKILNKWPKNVRKYGMKNKNILKLLE